MQGRNLSHGKIALVAIGAMIGGTASMSSAALLTVANSSFETPAMSDGAFTNPSVDTVPNWTGTANATNQWGVRNSQSGQFPGTTGANSGTTVLPGPADQWQFLYVGAGQDSQVLSDTLQNNTKYTLTVAVGKRLDGDGVNRLDITDYVMQLYAGSTLLTGTVTGSNAGITAGTFTDVSFTYTSSLSDPLAGQALKIVIGRNSNTNISSTLGFDNVRLDATAVPEPASLSLLGIGGLSLLARRRRSIA